MTSCVLESARLHAISAALSLVFVLALRLVKPSDASLVLDKCRWQGACTTAELDFSLRHVHCIVVNRGIVGETCFEDYPTCRCIPAAYDGFKPCISDKDCIEGEACVVYTPGANGSLAQLGNDYDVVKPFCASKAAEKLLMNLERYPRPDPPVTPTGNETVVDITTPVSAKLGLTLEKCKTHHDCASTIGFQVCRTVDCGTVGETCNGDINGCRCVLGIVDFTVCDSNDDCLVGKACVTFTGKEGAPLTQVELLDHTRPFCVSLRAVESLADVRLLDPSTTPPPFLAEGSDGGINTGDTQSSNCICIAAKSLGHLRREQLVFPKHVLTKVLCDENGSCATSGHMVVFRGNPMRMGTYCREHASCEVRTMEVNSPRYKRALRIRSDTAELEFTALAARFNTRAEEMVLSAAVRAAL